MILRIIALYIERFSFFSELLLQHMILTGISVAIITVLGLLTGIAMSRNKKVAVLVLRITSFLYTIPSIALFGFLVSITGIGTKSAVIALVLYGSLPIIRNTYTGLTEVDPEILEAATGMGSTRRQLLLRIQLPLALPMIISGFRTMVVMTIALGGIASFIGAGGLGNAIWRGINTNFPEMTIAGSLLVALFAIVSDWALEFVEKRLRKRYLGTKETGGQ